MSEERPENIKGKIEKACRFGDAVNTTPKLNLPKSLAKGLYIVPSLWYNRTWVSPVGTRPLRAVTPVILSLATHREEPYLRLQAVIPLSSE